jgi:iron(III) transport system permease protein
VFALAFSELGVPMFLRVDVYPAVIFARLGGMDFAPGEAAVFVVPLMGVAALVSSVERRYAGRRAIALLASREGAQGSLFGTRRGFVVPAALAAAMSSVPLAALAGHVAASGDVSEVLRWIGDAPLNSLRSSSLAAAIITAVALVIGHASSRRQRAAGWLDGLAMLAFILPSSIIGVGIVQAWNSPATAWLYTSFGILVIGFVARSGAIAIRTFAASVTQVPVSLEDAARTVGAGYVRRLGLVAGLARRGLMATFVLVWVFALRDLELAALFYPPGGEPLTVRIFTLEANGPRAVISALALLHVAITFGVVGLGVVLVGKPRAP